MPIRDLEAEARRLGLTRCRVLVAASGGVDSTVLAHGLHALRRRLDLELVLGHVHHGLRGAEADADQAAVAELAAKLDAPLRAARVAPRALQQECPSRLRPSLQEAARRARYAALDAMATESGAARIATAHTADDQAETVLLRLLRGTGPDGLAGMPERSPDGRLVRPLLRVGRVEIEAHARAQGLAWREDPSNLARRFARSRLRRDWLPGLARDFNPRLLNAIADLAEAQRRDAEWIADLVEREAPRWVRLEDAGAVLVREGWDSLPEALARRLVRWTLGRAGISREVTRTHLERTLRFLRRPRSGAVLELPGGLRLHCERAAFRLRPASSPPSDPRG